MELTYCVDVERGIEVERSSVGNFRDLADTLGAGPLRSGLIYRSDALHRYRKSDLDDLARLGIRRVLDLRTDPERSNDRVSDHDGIVTVRIPMIKDQRLLADRNARPAADGLAECYLDLAAANSGAIVLCIAEIIAAARDDEPVVIQGATGTDRTGVVAAVALALAGVDDHRIAADYSRSASAEPATMMAFLRGMRHHYGSVQGFLAWGGTDRAELEHCSTAFV